jgi:hypothetical protein
MLGEFGQQLAVSVGRGRVLLLLERSLGGDIANIGRQRVVGVGFEKLCGEFGRRRIVPLPQRRERCHVQGLRGKRVFGELLRQVGIGGN